MSSTKSLLTGERHLTAPYVEFATGSGPCSDLVLLCDHAGREVPADLDRLGLSDEALGRHIAWDIGAADVTRGLFARLGGTMILDHCSRLVIDPNRRPRSPTSIPPVSDGTVVPANRDLSNAEADRRLRQFFLPYHRRIARHLAAMRRAGRVPLVVAVHSFTPAMNGRQRPWQVGVLWRGDRRLAAPMLEALGARGDIVVGDNQPYSGIEDFGFTIQMHAQWRRLPHLFLEIRQDEIAERTSATRWADILADALMPRLSEGMPWRLFDGDSRAQLRDIPWRELFSATPLIRAVDPARGERA